MVALQCGHSHLFMVLDRFLPGQFSPAGSRWSFLDPPFKTRGMNTMKRIGTWAFYVISSLAILYLALYAYATFSGRHLRPGNPIHIFRNPAAPSYSQDKTS